MKTTLIVAVVSALTSGGFLAFLQFLISRHDRKQERAEDKEEKREEKHIEATLKEISEKLTKNEKDTIRTQLLLLILIRPQEETEILRLAEHYFKVLKGNWYMTSIFKNWLKDNKVAEPDWFETE